MAGRRMRACTNSTRAGGNFIARLDRRKGHYNRSSFGVLGSLHAKNLPLWIESMLIRARGSSGTSGNTACRPGSSEGANASLSRYPEACCNAIGGSCPPSLTA
jgi:hypothetical protein